MEGLPRYHKINGLRGQACGFGSTIHAPECRMCCEYLFAGPAHFRVRFDANDAVSVLKKRLRGDPGPGTYIRYRP